LIIKKDRFKWIRCVEYEDDDDDDEDADIWVKYSLTVEINGTTRRSLSKTWWNCVKEHMNSLGLSSSSSNCVVSRGPLRQPRVATTTSLGPFGMNAEGCTIADLLDP